ncbi:GDSL esterase/lipase At5g37690 [Salvia miltiorrhiza]|uniref:GDSL esterase/lipase At5g37690 n=1 Tax=Salvia miltiorrhiza TaxID=226208 RepID=UPI0025ACA0D9|nr:GDSL esterase/lipase At5g37690 [Salvia miltiorrhiza]
MGTTHAPITWYKFVAFEEKFQLQVMVKLMGGEVAMAMMLMVMFGAASGSASALVTFVFGDSLTEVGNNNYLQLSLAKSNYPYYGIDFEAAKPTGRFTNGRTIGDIISAKLGIPAPPPYLSLSPTDDLILKGVNYASGGAGILNHTGLYFIERLSFDDQIEKFKSTKQSMRTKIGDEASNKLCNEAVYFIGIGSNDYVNNFLQPFQADGQQFTHDEFLELLISTLAEQLMRLYEVGARKMIFHGLGPLGCIPSQRMKSSRGQCLNQVNLWVQHFNSKVSQLISTLNSHLPSSHLVFADTYQPVLDLINNPSSYGFKVSNTSCCKVDTKLGGLCLPNSKLCDNHDDYVFWDAFHPSDAANVVLADHFFNIMFANSTASAPQPSH